MAMEETGFNRDKASLDIRRLREQSSDALDNCPDPDVLAQASSKTSKPH